MHIVQMCCAICQQLLSFLLYATRALVGSQDAFAWRRDGVGDAPQLILFLGSEVVNKARHGDVTSTCTRQENK